MLSGHNNNKKQQQQLQQHKKKKKDEEEEDEDEEEEDEEEEIKRRCKRDNSIDSLLSRITRSVLGDSRQAGRKKQLHFEPPQLLAQQQMLQQHYHKQHPARYENKAGIVWLFL